MDNKTIFGLGFLASICYGLTLLAKRSTQYNAIYEEGLQEGLDEGFRAGMDHAMEHVEPQFVQQFGGNGTYH